MHVAGFGAGDDQRVFGHDVAQRAQLLFQQRQRFRHANQHHCRRRRQLGQAVQQRDLLGIQTVELEVVTRRQLAHVRVADAVRAMRVQRTGQGAEVIVENQHRAAADIYIFKLLQQIFVRCFPRLQLGGFFLLGITLQLKLLCSQIELAHCPS
ncbi:Uncharacterised protein [Acinetobacter baumannii]|nr:Uncharacterised protein [Acinetobacter baumannii]